ncbi:alkaline-phosphatase-like family protein isoform X2 [Wolffia australiana]
MASSMACSRLVVWTLVVVVLQILGLLLFVWGFFPVRPALSGLSGPESFLMPNCDHGDFPETKNLHPVERRALYEEMSQLPPFFDRLILMVIDGLPAEFLLGKGQIAPSEAKVSSMPYTHSLLSTGKALGYHALAATPTVTMPRLKAIVSGIVGGFLDVAFNFNTQEMLDDNLVDQFYNCDQKIVMFGDETWIRLFPGRFSRQDGVSSFYVKDTVEVDFNVSRHLESELASKDWNVMILHYLGLDHVGHIGGRDSFLMEPKMKEMDDVIREIHTRAILEHNNGNSTLLVVLSDHGMTNNGNHGGSSYEETDSLALLVGLPQETIGIRPKTYRTINQVDMSPTLAILFGLPIPKNNVGLLVKEVLDYMTDERKLRALEINSFQLLRLLQLYTPDMLCNDLCTEKDNAQDFSFRASAVSTKENICLLFSNAVYLHKSWRHMNIADTELSTVATHKPLVVLSAGMSLLIISCVGILSILFSLLKRYDEVRCPSWHWDIDEGYVILAVMIHLSSLASSSFVEEEQYTWHFLASTLYLIFLFMKIHSYLIRSPKATTRTRDGLSICAIIFILVSMRIVRAWHQGGVNWVHLPDISKSIEKAGMPVMKRLQISSLAFLACFSSLAIFFSKSRVVYGRLLITSHLISYLAVLFHVLGYPNRVSFIFLYGSLMLTLVISLTSSMETKGNSGDHPSYALYMIGLTCASSWCLLQLFLQQPVNSVPMLLVFLQLVASTVYFSLEDAGHNTSVQVAALYFVGMAGHYGLGNSNTLATIDVAGAFNGIFGQSTVLAGIMMLIITCASPLSYLFNLVLYISLTTRKQISAKGVSLGKALRISLGLSCLVPLALNSVSLTGFTFILFSMRNHLFIWSVFSPKYLYVCGATVCTYLGLGIVAVVVSVISAI